MYIIKIIILIFFCLAICLVNTKYEIFALHFPKGHQKVDCHLRVMTYNVNASLGNEDADEVKEGIIYEVEKQNPDILLLQDLSQKVFNKIQSSLDSLFNYTDSLVIKKEPYRYWIYSKKPIRDFNYYQSFTEFDSTGVRNLSHGEIKLLNKKMPLYSAEIAIESGMWIRVFSCHLRSSAYSTARRSMDKDASWMDGIPLYYENYIIGEKIRNWEADNFRQYLEVLEAEDIPIIIAGDFNDWGGSYCMNTIRDGKYKDAWWEGGFGFGITYNGWHLKLRLDHILYSHHFKLENVYVEKSKFSDHRPLVADFTLFPN
jgi:endonuclease/exonuclease/phosphatase family metal-dependent hydrolase